jgi:effector-binding domain-containing protein
MNWADKMSINITATVKTAKPAIMAYIQIKGPYSQIPQTFGRLYDWISKKEYKPTGPATVVYHSVPGQVPDNQSLWELRSRLYGDAEICQPDEQGLGIKSVEAFRVASVMHKGSYEKIEQTYSTLKNWISENNYEITGPYEELYLNSPEQVPPGELLTEIRFPVRKK